MAVKTVAGILGLTPARVRQLLDQDDCPLAGPPPPGRGHVREVWMATLVQYSVWTSTRDAKPEPRMVGLDERLASLDGIARRLNDLERVRPGREAALLYALEKSNAAADALRDAARDQDRARELRLDADRLDQQAMTALRRAEKAREESVPPL